MKILIKRKSTILLGVNRSVILLGLPVTECNVLLDEAVELVILKPAHQVVPVLQHQAGHALLNW